MADRTTHDATPVENADTIPAPPERSRKPWTAILALAFVFAPAIAFVVGDRARPIENQALPPAPSPGIGWQFFPKTSTWFTDHLPLRRQAIDANSSMTRTVFREEPNYGGAGAGSATGAGPAGVTGNAGNSGPVTKVQYPSVVPGKDGWLYYGGDFEKACKPSRTLDDTFTRLDRLARMVTRSGRRFVFTIAPNKSTIVPEELPDKYLGKDCWPSASRAFWQRVTDHPPPSYFPLRAELERQGGASLYRRLDTHWGSRGSAIYAKELADALDPSIWKGTRVERAGTQRSGGDLAKLLGENRTELVTVWNVIRPGVVGDLTKGNLLGPKPVHVINRSTGSALFKPRTVLLGDSFTQVSRPALFSLFADVVGVQNEDASAPTIAREVAKAQVVVVEIVERNLVGSSTKMLADSRLNAIEAALR